MKVRITAKAGYSNPRRGIECHTGDLCDIADDVAVKLLSMGLAVPAPKPEPRTVEAPAPPENTAQRTSKPKTKARRSSPPAKEEAE